MVQGMRLGSQDTYFGAENIMQETFWRVLLGSPPKKGDGIKTWKKFGCDVVSRKFLDDYWILKLNKAFQSSVRLVEGAQLHGKLLWGWIQIGQHQSSSKES